MTKPSMVGSSSKFKSCPSPEKVPLRDLISSSISMSSIDPTDARDSVAPAFVSASTSASSSANSSISITSFSASYTIQQCLYIQLYNNCVTMLICNTAVVEASYMSCCFTNGNWACKINHVSINYI